MATIHIHGEQVVELRPSNHSNSVIDAIQAAGAEAVVVTTDRYAAADIESRARVRGVPLRAVAAADFAGVKRGESLWFDPRLHQSTRDMVIHTMRVQAVVRIAAVAVAVIVLAIACVVVL